jgi:hypothetical protein
MPLLPKSLTQTFRRGNLLVGGGWRAYFAPFNDSLAITQTSTLLGPAILDLANQGPFSDNNIPTPYQDLGWIDGMKITPGSKIGTVTSGYRGAARAKYRGLVAETFEFQFREMTRTAMKLASGNEIFNLLQNANGVVTTAGPLNASGALAVPIGSLGYAQNIQYTPSGTGALTTVAAGLYMPAGSGALFPAGQMIVADKDYDNAYGLVGENATSVFQSAVTDIDFYRKTSDFVARVVSVVPAAVNGTSQDLLVLNKPFVGGGNAALGQTVYTGTPPPTAKVQAVKGFVYREGGSTIAEWSGLFLMNTVDGSQIALYYPHISPNQFKDLANWQIQDIGTGSNITGYALDAVFEAMAFDDPIDGETVVRYMAYYPTAGVDPQI